MSKTNDYEKIGRLLEDIVATGYSNKPRLLWYNFLKGLAYGFGLFLAGTVLIGFLLWGLSLFDEVPVIGRFVQNITDSLNAR
jgi:hypothetical protein